MYYKIIQSSGEHGWYMTIKIDQSISRKQECFGFIAALIPNSAPNLIMTGIHWQPETKN
jgi:hypothetical protein